MYCSWLPYILCPADPYCLDRVNYPTEAFEAIPAECEFIVAVDIGTTYTKVAWSRTELGKTVVHQFTDQLWKDEYQVPTTVLYKPSGADWEFAAFGHKAIKMHTRGEKNWALFKNFKMALHDKKVRCLTVLLAGDCTV